MRNAWILMTAMPPTNGHASLIEFTTYLAEVGRTRVILCTQPGEPFVSERQDALQEFCDGLPNVGLLRVHKTLPQEPADAEDFWDIWRKIFVGFGFVEGDIIVASEPYGLELAKQVGGKFLPYDIGRQMDHAKATVVRRGPLSLFADILPEFQTTLRRHVTIFGAESTGKTTLAKALAQHDGGQFAPEWARGYLEALGCPEVTREHLFDIWQGQSALQRTAQAMDKPFTFYDTDLFSTVGYWRLWEEKFGRVPGRLEAAAVAQQSDLYIITRSNIPFEPDPLRYGGDVRESSDQYWIDLCLEFSLPFVVLEAADARERLVEADIACTRDFLKNAEPLTRYQRRGSEYNGR